MPGTTSLIILISRQPSDQQIMRQPLIISSNMGSMKDDREVQILQSRPTSACTRTSWPLTALLHIGKRCGSGCAGVKRKDATALAHLKLQRNAAGRRPATSPASL